jgi:hypothetical protein
MFNSIRKYLMSEESVNEIKTVEDLGRFDSEGSEEVEEVVVFEDAVAEEEAPVVPATTPAVVERLGRFDSEGSEEVKFSDGTTGFFKS